MKAKTTDLAKRESPLGLAETGEQPAERPFRHCLDGGTDLAFANMVADGKDDLIEAILEDQRKLETQLGADSAPPLELILIRNVVRCHLAVAYFEQVQMNNLSRDVPEEYAKLVGKRLVQAQQRYLESIKTLALIRKLKLPNIQVNMAEKQVNYQA